MSTEKKKKGQLESTQSNTKNKLSAEKKMTAKIPDLNFKIKKLEKELIHTKELLEETTGYYKTLHEEYQKKEHEVMRLHEIERKYKEQTSELNKLKISFEIKNNDQTSELNKLKVSYGKIKNDFLKANDKANSALCKQSSLKSSESQKKNLNSKISDLNQIIVEHKTKAEMVEHLQQTIENANSEIQVLSNLTEQKKSTEERLLAQYNQAKLELNEIPKLVEKTKKLENTITKNNLTIDDLNKKQFSSEIVIAQIPQLQKSINDAGLEINRLRDIAHDADKRKSQTEVLYKVFEKKCMVIPGLNEQIGGLKQEIQDLDVVITSKDSDLKAMEDCYKDEFSNLEKLHIDEMTNLEKLHINGLENIAKLNESINELKKELSEKNSTIQNQQQEFSLLDQEKDRFQRQVYEIPIMESVLKHTKEQSMILNEKILELTQGNLAQQQEIEDFKATIQDKEDWHKTTIQEKDDQLKATIQDREDLIVNTGYEKEVFHKCIQEHQEEIDYYRTRYFNAEKCLEVIPELEFQIKDLKQQKESLKNEVEKVSKEAADALIQIQNIKSDYGRCQYENEQHCGEIDRTHRKISDLDVLLQEKNSKISESFAIQSENQILKENLEREKITIAQRLDDITQLQRQKKELEKELTHHQDSLRQMDIDYSLKLADREKWASDLQLRSSGISEAYHLSEELKYKLENEIKNLKLKIAQLEKENFRLCAQEITSRKAYEENKELEHRVSHMNRDCEEWMNKYSKARAESNHFWPEYQVQKMENESMRNACDDHVYDTEKKAALINTLQMKLVCAQSELDRISKRDATVVPVEMVNFTLR